MATITITDTRTNSAPRVIVTERNASAIAANEYCNLIHNLRFTKLVDYNKTEHDTKTNHTTHEWKHRDYTISVVVQF
jgi:hypothetical protein